MHALKSQVQSPWISVSVRGVLGSRSPGSHRELQVNDYAETPGRSCDLNRLGLYGACICHLCAHKVTPVMTSPTLYISGICTRFSLQV